MGTGKKKIEIKKKEKAEDRIVTFSKRKKGLFKKASQLNALSGSHVGIVVFSPAGRPHTNAPMFDNAMSVYLSSSKATADTFGGNSGDDVGLGLKYLENVLLGSVKEIGAASNTDVTDDFWATENSRSIKEWLNCIEVEKIEKVEDLLLIKQRLEIMREKISDKICSTYLV